MLKWTLATILSLATQAGAQTHAPADMFSEAEIRQNKAGARLISETAADCLDSTYADHVEFFYSWRPNVSKYFGVRHKRYQTLEGRKIQLRAYGFDEQEVAAISAKQVGTSCVGMAMECLAMGFGRAGMAPTWDKIFTELKRDHNGDGKGDFLGTELIAMLRMLGWKVYYWNPNPAQNAAWDAEDQRLSPIPEEKRKNGAKVNPVWGQHSAFYNQVMRKGSYYGITVDNAKSLVGFGDVAPKAFANVPFFVGVAHAGYHVFPGRRGEVIEAHSVREMNSIDNLEFSTFNPLGTGGGPKWTPKERYRSGIIAVPGDF